MFLLVNSNLPASPIPLESPGPLCTVFMPNAGMGPLLKVDTQSSISSGWTTQQLPIEVPAYTGNYYQISLPVTPDTVTIAGYNESDSAVDAVPNNYWLDDDLLNLYAGTTFSEFQLSYTASAPYPISNNYTFTLPAGLTVTGVVSEGLTFTPGSSVGNFSQSGTTLTVFGSSLYNLPYGQDVSVTGSLSITLPTANCAIASFYFPTAQFVDAMDWAGVAFNPMQDDQNPQLSEFSWNQPTQTVNVFLPISSMPNYPASTTQNTYFTGFDFY